VKKRIVKEAIKELEKNELAIKDGQTLVAVSKLNEVFLRLLKADE